MDERRRTSIRNLIEGHTRTVKAGTSAEARASLEKGELWSRNGGIYHKAGPRGDATPNYAAVPDNSPRSPSAATPGRK